MTFPYVLNGSCHFCGCSTARVVHTEAALGAAQALMALCRICWGHEAIALEILTRLDALDATPV